MTAADQAELVKAWRAVRVAVLENGALKQLRHISDQWVRASEAMLRAEQAATDRAVTFRATAGDLAAAIKPVLTEGITSRQQRFLDAAATLETLGVDLTRETVSAWVGVHPRGGSVGEELKALVDAGFIVLDRGRIGVTERGANAAGYIDPADAIARAKEALTPRQRRIFDIAVSAYPDETTKTAIAEQMGIHERGGSFGEDLGRLRGRGLIEYARGIVRARDFLFAGAAR